jgi:hypothetical protein
VKRVDITSAANDATAQLSTPARSRTATGGFAKQLKRATATRGTIQPPIVVTGETGELSTSTAPASTTTSSPQTPTATLTPAPAADRDVADATHSASVIARPVGRGLVSAAMRAVKQQQLQPQLQLQPQPQIAPQPQAPIAIAAPAIQIAPVPPPQIEQVATAAPGVAPVVDDADDDQLPITTTAAPVAPAVDDTSTDATPRTPLEQAVHDLLSQLGSGKHDQPSHDDDAAGEQASAQKLSATAQTAAPAKSESFAPAAPAAPVAEPDAQQLQSAHHAHIVIGDDADRIVMTVAVRGSAVNVTVKTADDHTAAAIARNVGTLDDAIRNRGLELDQFETPRESPRERQQYEQRQRAKPDSDSTEPFELEEQV